MAGAVARYPPPTCWNARTTAPLGFPMTVQKHNVLPMTVQKHAALPHDSAVQ